MTVPIKKTLPNCPPREDVEQQADAAERLLLDAERMLLLLGQQTRVRLIREDHAERITVEERATDE